MIEFYDKKTGKLVGTVATDGMKLYPSNDVVGSIAESMRWYKNPEAFMSYYSNWTNGYLYSKVSG